MVSWDIDGIVRSDSSSTKKVISHSSCHILNAASQKMDNGSLEKTQTQSAWPIANFNQNSLAGNVTAETTMTDASVKQALIASDIQIILETVLSQVTLTSKSESSICNTSKNERPDASPFGSEKSSSTRINAKIAAEIVDGIIDKICNSWDDHIRERHNWSDTRSPCTTSQHSTTQSCNDNIAEKEHILFDTCKQIATNEDSNAHFHREHIVEEEDFLFDTCKQIGTSENSNTQSCHKCDAERDHHPSHCFPLCATGTHIAPLTSGSDSTVSNPPDTCKNRSTLTVSDNPKSDTCGSSSANLFSPVKTEDLSESSSKMSEDTGGKFPVKTSPKAKSKRKSTPLKCSDFLSKRLFLSQRSKRRRHRSFDSNDMEDGTVATNFASPVKANRDESAEASKNSSSIIINSDSEFDEGIQSQNTIGQHKANSTVNNIDDPNQKKRSQNSVGQHEIICNVRDLNNSEFLCSSKNEQNIVQSPTSEKSEIASGNILLQYTDMDSLTSCEVDSKATGLRKIESSSGCSMAALLGHKKSISPEDNTQNKDSFVIISSASDEGNITLNSLGQHEQCNSNVSTSEKSIAFEQGEKTESRNGQFSSKSQKENDDIPSCTTISNSVQLLPLICKKERPPIHETRQSVDVMDDNTLISNVTPILSTTSASGAGIPVSSIAAYHATCSTSSSNKVVICSSNVMVDPTGDHLASTVASISVARTPASSSKDVVCGSSAFIDASRVNILAPTAAYTPVTCSAKSYNSNAIRGSRVSLDTGAVSNPVSADAMDVDTSVNRRYSLRKKPLTYYSEYAVFKESMYFSRKFHGEKSRNLKSNKGSKSKCSGRNSSKQKHSTAGANTILFCNTTSEPVVTTMPSSSTSTVISTETSEKPTVCKNMPVLTSMTTVTTETSKKLIFDDIPISTLVTAIPAITTKLITVDGGVLFSTSAPTTLPVKSLLDISEPTASTNTICSTLASSGSRPDSSSMAYISTGDDKSLSFIPKDSTSQVAKGGSTEACQSSAVVSGTSTSTSAIPVFSEKSGIPMPSVNVSSKKTSECCTDAIETSTLALANPTNSETSECSALLDTSLTTTTTCTVYPINKLRYPSNNFAQAPQSSHNELSSNFESESQIATHESTAPSSTEEIRKHKKRSANKRTSIRKRSGQSSHLNYSNKSSEQKKAAFIESAEYSSGKNANSSTHSQTHMAANPSGDETIFSIPRKGHKNSITERNGKKSNSRGVIRNSSSCRGGNSEENKSLARRKKNVRIISNSPFANLQPTTCATTSSEGTIVDEEQRPLVPRKNNKRFTSVSRAVCTNPEANHVTATCATINKEASTDECQLLVTRRKHSGASITPTATPRAELLMDTLVCSATSSVEQNRGIVKRKKCRKRSSCRTKNTNNSSKFKAQMKKSLRKGLLPQALVSIERLELPSHCHKENFYEFESKLSKTQVIQSNSNSAESSLAHDNVLNGRTRNLNNISSVARRSKYDFSSLQPECVISSPLGGSNKQVCHSELFKSNKSAKKSSKSSRKRLKNGENPSSGRANSSLGGDSETSILPNEQLGSQRELDFRYTPKLSDILSTLEPGIVTCCFCHLPANHVLGIGDLFGPYRPLAEEVLARQDAFNEHLKAPEMCDNVNPSYAADGSPTVTIDRSSRNCFITSRVQKNEPEVEGSTVEDLSRAINKSSHHLRSLTTIDHILQDSNCRTWRSKQKFIQDPQNNCTVRIPGPKSNCKITMDKCSTPQNESSQTSTDPIFPNIDSIVFLEPKMNFSHEPLIPSPVTSQSSPRASRHRRSHITPRSPNRDNTVGLTDSTSVSLSHRFDTRPLWTHGYCAVWANGIYAIRGQLYGLWDAMRDSRKINCALCERSGASIVTFEDKFEADVYEHPLKAYHYPCALNQKLKLNWNNFTANR